MKGDNPLTGPFHVEGAEPGDTLVVKFLELQLDSEQGVGAFAPGFGALSTTFYTPMLNPPLPERVDILSRGPRAQRGHVPGAGLALLGGDSALALHRLHRRGASAGRGPRFRHPGEWGGNMIPEASPGHTLYLPVNVAGALLYVGDGHAVQGDGEVAGTGLEIAMKVRLQVDLIKKKAIRWPRFETGEELMAVGAYRRLDDALRIAFTELIAWIKADFGLSELDAYELLSKVAHIRVSEMVDPNYVVIAKVAKKYLPPRKQ